MHMEDQGGGDGAPVAIPPQEGEEEVNSILSTKLLRLKLPTLKLLPALAIITWWNQIPRFGHRFLNIKKWWSRFVLYCLWAWVFFLNSNLSLAMRAMRLPAGKGERGQWWFPYCTFAILSGYFFSIHISQWIQSWSWNLVINILSLQRYQACWYSAQRFWRIPRLWSRDEVLSPLLLCSRYFDVFFQKDGGTSRRGGRGERCDNFVIVNQIPVY